jgi:GT2 family glycosyltransferase
VTPAGSATVVVVVRNGEAVIDRCLECLLVQDHADFEVIVVDDGSTDRTVERTEAHLDSGRVSIQRSRGRGVSAARNTGLGAARGEVVAYIDADGYADRGWLRAASDALAADPSAGAVASMVFFDGTRVLNGAGGTMDIRGYASDHCFGEPFEAAEPPSEALYPMGCGMVFRRRALEEVGGFDEAFVNYYDDTEVGIRLWRSGWQVVVVPGARIEHGYSHGSDPKRKELLTERHRIRTMLVHLDPSLVPRFLAGEAPWLLIPTEARELKWRAWIWNLRGLAGAMAGRVRWSGAPPVPRRLLAPGRSWFPALTEPPDGPWLYGWFEPAREDGHRFRWGAKRAGALLDSGGPAGGIEITYRLPPRSPGAQIELRGTDASAPLARADLPATSAWRTERLRGDCPAGCEIVLTSPYAYPDRRRRQLAIAVAELRPLEA